MMNNKALFGLLGVGTLAAAWFLLPKDSKIKKAIVDGACQLTDGMRARMTTVAKNVSAETVRNS